MNLKIYCKESMCLYLDEGCVFRCEMEDVVSRFRASKRQSLELDPSKKFYISFKAFRFT